MTRGKRPEAPIAPEDLAHARDVVLAAAAIGVNPITDCSVERIITEWPISRSTVYAAQLALHEEGLIGFIPGDKRSIALELRVDPGELSPKTRAVMDVIEGIGAVLRQSDLEIDQLVGRIR